MYNTHVLEVCSRAVIQALNGWAAQYAGQDAHMSGQNWLNFEDIYHPRIEQRDEGKSSLIPGSISPENLVQ
jgi:hypothetical protein